ncbi:hypothetical protein Syun_002331 [Stephania yunnanensis]|uniref:Uncharacterized protein n=1 Tax=Stephania yunnanensis TaxID=152371 RepID=A0AAP0LFK3_9MAGN
MVRRIDLGLTAFTTSAALLPPWVDDDDDDAEEPTRKKEIASPSTSGQDVKLDSESITEDVLNLSVSDDPRSTTCSNSVGN